MLRINLLPVRQLKKRAKAKNQILGFCVVFACLVGILFLVLIYQTGKIKYIQSNITELTNEQKRLAPEIAAVDKLKKDKEELDRKISIINQLKAESSLTVRVLDEVANVVDNGRMWLTTLTQEGNSLSLTGIALDNQTVAQFMEMLKKSTFIQSVNLSNSSLKKISDRSLKEFVLVCDISRPKQEQPKTDIK